MDIAKLEQESSIPFSTIFSGDAKVDLEFTEAYLEPLPTIIANDLLCEFANEYPSCNAHQIDTLKRSFEVKVKHFTTDIKWMRKQLEKLPSDVVTTLQNTYYHKRIKYRNGRSANIWLRQRVSALNDMLWKFPLPIEHINSEVRRTQVAQEWSNRCLTMLNKMTEDGIHKADAKKVLFAVKEPADMWGFCPTLPDLTAYEQAVANGEDVTRVVYVIVNAIARLTDAIWWQRQLERAFKQYKEHAAIIIGKVRIGVSPYVSHKTLVEYQAKKKANAAWVNLMTLINEQHDLELPLADAVLASISNPELRRIELMVRMRGFEELAAQQGYVGEFYTWTAPSKYHSWKKGKSGKAYSNSKYKGASPRKTQKYFCKQWSKVRAKLDRNDITTFGFRVVEPHHDGTPHWHLLLFFKPVQVEQARKIICDYAVEHDKEELNIKLDDYTPDDCSPRFDYKSIDPTKGSATGYIAKYIAKNIDGAYVDADFEAESSGKHGAQGVAAWASTWNIRQFQQIGGASVTVWRELRRLHEQITNDDILERARKAADSANWQAYIEANGGIKCKRDARPVKLAKTVNEAASRYGEDIIKIKGVIANMTATTRLEGWEIHDPSKQSLKSEDESQFEEAVRSLSSGSCAPWRSDNNCTQQLEQLNITDQQLAIECQKLGLDEFSASRLRVGSVICNIINGNNQYIQLKNGELIVSSHPLSADHDLIDNGLWQCAQSMKRDNNEALDKELRGQAWDIYHQGKDIEQWISTMEPWMAKQALEKLSEVVELHKRE